MKNIKTLIYSLLLIGVLLLPISQSSFVVANATPEYGYDDVSEMLVHRVGAKCCDGANSKATGRGACSHHGGVKYWKLSDGTKEWTGRCD